MPFAVRPNADQWNERSATHLVVTSSEGPDGQLEPYEALVVETVGNVIEFWGFKRNQGRIWALLYLRGRAMDAAELRAVLALSKGAVSMVTRELEQWRIIRRVRPSASAVWRFEANTDLLAMIGGVLEAREGLFVSRVKRDLAEAEHRVRARSDVPSEVVDRVTRMRRLADVVQQAVELFAKTATLDARAVIGVLRQSVSSRLQKGKR